MNQIGRPNGQSAYFRLSTRPVDQSLARIPKDVALLERRRQHAVAGGYRISHYAPAHENVTLVGVGAIMPEVLAAAARLNALGVTAGVICLTSPDLVFRSLQDRHRIDGSPRSAIVDELFPADQPTPLVTVLDGHPHTLAFLAGVRGDRTRNLGVTEFGQSSDLEDAYRIHGIDVDSIVRAAIDLIGRWASVPQTQDNIMKMCGVAAGPIVTILRAFVVFWAPIGTFTGCGPGRASGARQDV